MKRSMSDEDFDWFMDSENPNGNSSSTADDGQSAQDDGYSHQQPPLPTTVGSSSMRHVNGNGGFLAHNGGFPIQNVQQQQLPPPPPMGPNHFGPNPVRSIFEYRDRFPADVTPFEYCCDYCDTNSFYSYDYFHPGHASFDHQAQSSMNGLIPQTPYDGRNLEIDFGRLSLSSPNHHLPPFIPSHPPPYGSNIRNNSFNIGNVYPHGRVPAAPVRLNQDTGFHDQLWNQWSNRRESFELNQIGFNNVLDRNPVRSRDWPVRKYVNPRNDYRLWQKPTRPRYPESLEEIRGLIYFVAKEQEGCQYLQTKCEEGNPKDIEMIFNETKDHIHELMVDASTNYLVQKLFKLCNERQMTHIVFSLVTTDNGSFTSICANSHGTRAMQKLIELVTTSEQRSMIVSAVRRITLTLSKNTNGQHVIQCCVKYFHVDEVQPILDVVADNCVGIATDRSGCCMLQQCVSHATGISKERLITDIIANAIRLSQDPYGNYVVQHLVGMQIPDVTSDIIQMLSGKFIGLSLNKYASNVVEKCLKEAGDDQFIVPIVREFINSQNLLAVIQSAYGNYVVQSALRAAKGRLKEIMIKKVRKEYPFIHSHPHGKRVLDVADQVSKKRD